MKSPMRITFSPRFKVVFLLHWCCCRRHRLYARPNAFFEAKKNLEFFRLFRFLLANIILFFTRPPAYRGEAEKHRPYPTGYPCSSVALPPYPLFIGRAEGAAYCEERSTVQKPRDLVHSAPPSLRRLRSKRTLYWPVNTVLYVEADGHPSEVENTFLPCSVKWEYLVNDVKLVARVPMRTWDDINGVGRVSQVLDCNQGTYCTVT